MNIFKTLLYFAVCAVSAIPVSCTKESPDSANSSDKLNIIDLRSAGKEIPGTPAYNLSDCKVEGAEKTLKSLRYVDPLPIYFMDYYAKVDWNSLIKDPEDRYAVGDIESLTTDMDALLYNKAPAKSVLPSKGACSGFVCFNPEGDLLVGRNYDGDTEPLVVLFNKAVDPGEHRSLIMTDLQLMQGFFGESYEHDDCLLEKGRNLNVLLRQPFLVVDGMNDAGLCLAVYQLPSFQGGALPEEEGPGVTERPVSVDQNTGKKQLPQLIALRKILTESATVEDVVALLQSYDYTNMLVSGNMHWLVADAKGDWRILEYWRGSDGKDSLIVLDEDARYKAAYQPVGFIPYEYRCIENYYCNKEATLTFVSDFWQCSYTTKARVSNMMHHYSPVMTEDEALKCLQFGNYGIEVPNEVTDWSCVYNTRKKTMIFNMRDDLSTVYSVDLNKDLL